MSKLLVTGGAGFIGSHLVDKLVHDGHEVVIIDNLSTGKKEYINPRARFEQKDIRDYASIEPVFKGVEAVFHLAADARLQMSIDDPLTTHATNVTGTLNVLYAAHKAGVKKVVFASSCAVYGDIEKLPLKETMQCSPLSPYGLHKYMGEQYCRVFANLVGLPTVALRFFNVFGPRKTADGAYPMVIPIFLKQRAAGESMTIVGDGEQTRDYVHVRDVVAACVAAWQSAVGGGEIINIGNGRQISINDIARMLGGPTKTIPERKGEMRFIEASNAKAKRLLKWKPKVKFEDGLRELVGS